MKCLPWIRGAVLAVETLEHFLDLWDFGSGECGWWVKANCKEKRVLFYLFEIKTFVKNGANSNSIDFDFQILNSKKELWRSDCSWWLRDTIEKKGAFASPQVFTLKIKTYSKVKTEYCQIEIWSFRSINLLKSTKILCSLIFSPYEN